MNKKPVFDAVRKILGRSFTDEEVEALDDAIDLCGASLRANVAPQPAEVPAPGPALAVVATGGGATGAEAVPHAPASAGGRSLGTAGANLIKKWEGCEKRSADGNSFAAYPDPGSADGRPWTIGWGSTGLDVKQGVVWTAAQCDARFDQDILKYVRQVAEFLGDAKTTPNQFDALVSFHYNTGAIRTATLAKLHKQGKFNEAHDEFGKWIFNNHKPMKGLISRRADEAKLYAKA